MGLRAPAVPRIVPGPQGPTAPCLFFCLCIYERELLGLKTEACLGHPLRVGIETTEVLLPSSLTLVASVKVAQPTFQGDGMS